MLILDLSVFWMFLARFSASEELSSTLFWLTFSCVDTKTCVARTAQLDDLISISAGTHLNHWSAGFSAVPEESLVPAQQVAFLSRLGLFRGTGNTRCAKPFSLSQPQTEDTVFLSTVSCFARALEKHLVWCINDGCYNQEMK